jgi:hypothetical protein
LQGARIAPRASLRGVEQAFAKRLNAGGFSSNGSICDSRRQPSPSEPQGAGKSMGLSRAIPINSIGRDRVANLPSFILHCTMHLRLDHIPVI